MTGIEIGLMVIGGGAFFIGSATSTYLVKRREERKRDAKVFGKSLDEFKLKRMADCGVPLILEKWFQRIEKEGVNTEGIFRISATQTVLMELFKKIDLDGGESEDFDEQQIHVISGLIKLYLRELPDCLLCYKFYNEFLQIEKTEDDIEKWKEKIQATLNKIPDRNALLLQRLLQMLTKVKDNSEENKMTAGNLAVVFGPCLIFSLEPKEALSLFSDSSTITSLVAKLIENGTKFNLKRDFQPLDPKKRKQEKKKKEKKKDPENGVQTPDNAKSKKEKKEEKKELKKKKKEEKKLKDSGKIATPRGDEHEHVANLGIASTALSSLDFSDSPKKKFWTSNGDSSMSVSPSESLDSFPSTPSAALSPRTPSDNEKSAALSPRTPSYNEKPNETQKEEKDIEKDTQKEMNNTVDEPSENTNQIRDTNGENDEKTEKETHAKEETGELEKETDQEDKKTEMQETKTEADVLPPAMPDPEIKQRTDIDPIDTDHDIPLTPRQLAQTENETELLPNKSLQKQKQRQIQRERLKSKNREAETQPETKGEATEEKELQT